jgi:hypothetical protein
VRNNEAAPPGPAANPFSIGKTKRQSYISRCMDKQSGQREDVP